MSKPVEKRLEETINIRYQMRQHGIDSDPGVVELIDDMNTFVRHGEETSGISTLSIGPRIYWNFSNSQISHVHVMKNTAGDDTAA